MRTWTIAIAAVTLLAFALPVGAQDLNMEPIVRPENPWSYGASALTDARTIDARLEFRNGVITTGPIVSWNKEQPDHVWGGGVFGMISVTPNGTIPIRNLIPVVGEWLQLPETIDAEINLGAQVEVVNVAHGPSAAGAPFVEVAIGPLLLNFRWQIAESGQIEDLMESEKVFFIGVRPLWF